MTGGTQIFVRNREGKVFGPIEPSTVELLIDGGVLQGLLQVSTDGESYALPYRFPQLRDYFPRHLWGDDDRRDVQLDAESGAPAGSSGPVEGQLDAALFGADAQTDAAGDRASTPPAVGRAPKGGRPAAPGRPVPAPSAAPPVLTAAPAEPVAPAPTAAAGRTPTDSVPVITAEPLTSPPAPAPGRTPTGTFQTVPVLTAAPAEPIAPAPAAAAGRTPTGSVPVLTAEPLTPPPTRGQAPLEPQDAWAEAVPFELAPPGASKPPARAATPLTSTFSLLRADLAETNALKVYVQGARASATGLFFFDLEDRTATVYMRRGNPESAESTHASDAIGPFLVAQRLATADQVSRAEHEAIKYGNDVLAALFTIGAVNPGLVFPALAQRAADILLHAYLAPRGSFRFEALELPASKVVPLGNRWGLLAEVIRRVPLPDLKSRLMDVRERPVVRRSAGDSLPDLRLTAQETRAMGYFDGTRSLAHLAQSNAGEMDTILRVALLLRELDAVSFPEVTLRAPPAPPPRPEPAAPSRPTPVPPVATPPPRPAPAAAAPAPPRKPTAPSAPAATQAPAAPRAPAITPTGLASLPQADPPRIAPMPTPRPASPGFTAELRALQAKLEKIRKENHFQVLGVPENVDAAAVKAAYFKLAKLYHPDTVPPDAPPELGRAKAEIFAAIGEANRMLADDASRARYKETLADGGPGEVDVQSVLQAEETFNKGTALVRARRFPEAVKTFDDAIAANPREGEFYAWRGYARFFTLPDKKVAMVEALRDLNQSLKLNERCAPAHYFIGQLYKLTGDATTALKHFKRCVALDPQHVDAQREIRIAGQK